jgi:hypothetical protein
LQAKSSTHAAAILAKLVIVVPLIIGMIAARAPHARTRVALALHSRAACEADDFATIIEQP